MSTAILVENLGKKYVIKHEQARAARYATFREMLIEKASSALHFGKKDKSGQANEDFWALRDVSFELKQGERLGVIGRNGAGKSTMLKLLSRITEPTTGRISVKGRIASLLEVGTGFHPELTGRENIYLNGAILGMTRKEIQSKFDEIVDFAEIEKFLDTPVKRYSSGMYVRLAFAVAAHLEPEILIVDEVLAVGDLQFQKKCLGKMETVGREGRTVILVSHNMSAITRLCTKAILLNQGRLETEGEAQDVVSQYIEGAGGSGTFEASARNTIGGGGFRLTSIQVMDEKNNQLSVANIENPIYINIRFCTETPGLQFRFKLSFLCQGVVAFCAVQPEEVLYEKKDEYEVILKIPGNLLAEEYYGVNVAAFHSQGGKTHYLKMVEPIGFQVYDPVTGNSVRGDYTEAFGGVVRPRFEWMGNTL